MRSLHHSYKYINMFPCYKRERERERAKRAIRTKKERDLVFERACFFDRKETQRDEKEE